MLSRWTLTVLALLAALPCAAQPPRSAGKPIGNTLDMLFVAIPPGKVQIGSSDEETGREIEIKEPFYLGIHEVTVGQFRRFVAATGYRTTAETNGVGGHAYNALAHRMEQDRRYTWKSPGYEQTEVHPVVLVSWSDAKAFCEWLSKEEKRTYRLPTEAEWEYACRAGSTTRFPFGDDDRKLVDYGNVADATLKVLDPNAAVVEGYDGHLFPAPVCLYKPNAWGLYDMHGNAAEWCGDPFGTNGEKATRGGSWCSAPAACRSAARVGMSPDFASIGVGFRIVCENPKL